MTSTTKIDKPAEKGGFLLELQVFHRVRKFVIEKLVFSNILWYNHEESLIEGDMIWKILIIL